MAVAFSSTIKGKDFWLSLQPTEDRLVWFDKSSSESSTGSETKEPTRQASKY